MNENIDLTKILKDCPKGTKLYSTVHGEVSLISCNTILCYPIVVRLSNNREESFTAKGKLFIDCNNGECVLFPSKDQRDWSKFSAPWYKKEKFDPKTLKPFDRVLVRENYPTENWYAAYFSHIEYDVSKYDVDAYEETPEFIICTTDTSGFWYCIPYNDDTKHLVGTEEEAPEYYRYWKN